MIKKGGIVMKKKLLFILSVLVLFIMFLGIFM